LDFERKNVDPIKIRNCGRYLIFSNNNTPIKIERTDRRFVVFECDDSKIRNKQYFQDLADAFNDDEMVKSFYNSLKERDISNWKPIQDRPITEAYEDIQSATIPIMAQFLNSKLNDYGRLKDEDEDYEDYEELGATEFYQEISNWLYKSGNKHIKYTQTLFGREIKRYESVVKKHSNRVKYYIDYPKLREELTMKKLLM
jgi:hypothetical protein